MSIDTSPPPENLPVWDLPQRLELAIDIEQLKQFIITWVEESDREVRDMIRWQLLSTPKYFRPVTVFACHWAVKDDPVPLEVFRSAVALELIHNVSLIIDDILDHSRYRRGKLSLHCRYGMLPALMVAGYLTAAALKLTAEDAYSIGLLTGLLQRLGVAECSQWRLRRQPLGVEDWRMIASEDTGSMFETCAQLGTRDDRLRKFGQTLGILYHGCDDVADVRGTEALGGSGQEDIRDGILTLPAALAIRDPHVAVLFRTNETDNKLALLDKFRAALPKAEDYLDKLAREAEVEVQQNAVFRERLIALIGYTRALSKS